MGSGKWEDKSEKAKGKSLRIKTSIIYDASSTEPEDLSSGGLRKAKGKRQKAKAKNQKAKGKRQKPKGKSQKAKAKRQKPKGKNQKAKTKNQKPKTKSPSSRTLRLFGK